MLYGITVILISYHATLTLSQYTTAMSLYHTPYYIATHILTAATTPVTSTLLLANICISSTLPVRAALNILLFSSYNNITDNNIILLIQYQSHIYAAVLF